MAAVPSAQTTRKRTAAAFSTRNTAVLAATALALSAFVAPAAAEDAPPALSVHNLTPDESRSSAELSPPPADAPDGVVRLDATPTAQEGVVTSARKPQVLKREGRLWMYRSTDDYPPDEQDVKVVNVRQDIKAKRIIVDAEYYATPTASLNTIVWVYAGRWNKAKETCKGEVVVAGVGHGASSNAAFADVKGKEVGKATRSFSGGVLRITATGNGAANQKYDCVFAYVDEPLTETTTRQLKSSGAEDFKAQMEKAPEFQFHSSKLNAAYPGKWNKVYISVKNSGNLTAKKVKLKLSGKGLKFKKKTVSLGTIKAGKSKSVNVQVKLTGKKTRSLSAKATATGKWTAKTSTKVGYRPKPKKVKSLVGNSYWASSTGDMFDNIWQVHGLTFVNKTWVYVGVPKSGTPKCSSKVKECKKYSYSAKNGKLKIGKLQAKVNSEGIKVTKVAKKGDPKVSYTPLKSVKKGSKIGVKLEYWDGSGRCGITPSCSSWWQFLTLKKNGKFTWTRNSISTFGFPPFQTFVSTSGPTKKGTYKILSKNRIQFSYVDAETGKKKKETHTIGIDSNELGKHSPKYGLLIGAMPHLP